MCMRLHLSIWSFLLSSPTKIRPFFKRDLTMWRPAHGWHPIRSEWTRMKRNTDNVYACAQACAHVCLCLQTQTCSYSQRRGLFCHLSTGPAPANRQLEPVFAHDVCVCLCECLHVRESGGGRGPCVCLCECLYVRESGGGRGPIYVCVHVRMQNQHSYVYR